MCSTRFNACTAGFAIALLCGPAAAQAPAALVEELRGNPPGIQLMDYVTPGQIIRLGTDDVIILSYLASCVRESIAGGTVTVGQQQSNVKSGTVQRTKMPCGEGRAQLTSQQANQSAAMVFRDASGFSGRSQVTLHSVVPIIDVRGGSRLTVTRIDRKGERIKLLLDAGDLVHGAFYDFALANRRLTAGGIYRATLDGHSIVFKIHENASLIHTAVISRFLRFPAGPQ